MIINCNKVGIGPRQSSIVVCDVALVFFDRGLALVVLYVCFHQFFAIHISCFLYHYLFNSQFLFHIRNLSFLFSNCHFLISYCIFFLLFYNWNIFIPLMGIFYFFNWNIFLFPIGIISFYV